MEVEEETLHKSAQSSKADNKTCSSAESGILDESFESGESCEVDEAFDTNESSQNDESNINSKRKKGYVFSLQWLESRKIREFCGRHKLKKTNSKINKPSKGKTINHAKSELVIMIEAIMASKDFAKWPIMRKKVKDYDLFAFRKKTMHSTALIKELQSVKEPTINWAFVLFFIAEDRNLICAASTQSGWTTVRSFVNRDFPVRVIKLAGDAKSIIEIKRRRLFETTIETLRDLPPHELRNKTKCLYYSVKELTCKIKKGSELEEKLNLKNCKAKKAFGIKATMGGIIRILARISLSRCADVISIFEEYLKRTEEKPDPLFEFLHFLQPEFALKADLDDLLMKKINDNPDSFHVRHKCFIDFIMCENLRIKLPNGQSYDLKSCPPSLREIKTLIGVKNNTSFVKIFKKTKLIFTDTVAKDDKEEKLVDCVDGVLHVNNRTYFKINTMWYTLNVDYVKLLNDDYNDVVGRTLITDDSDEAQLLHPWKTKLAKYKITKDRLKKYLVQSSCPNIDSFWNELKSMTVYYITPDNKIMQTELVGEILNPDNDFVRNHKISIEEVLCSLQGVYDCERMQKELQLKNVNKEDIPKILLQLQKMRSVLNSTGELVINPIAYPLKEKFNMADKEYGELMTFLKNSYEDYTNTEEEKDFNRSYFKKPNYLVFDRVIVDNLELCDIMKWTDDNVYLYHVKEKLGQSTRDATSQILSAANFLSSALSTNESPTYLDKLYNKAKLFGDSGDPSKLPVDEVWRCNVKEQMNQFATSEEFKKKFFKNEIRKTITFVYAYVNHKSNSTKSYAQQTESNIAKIEIVNAYRKLQELHFDFKICRILRKRDTSNVYEQLLSQPSNEKQIIETQPCSSNRTGQGKRTSKINSPQKTVKLTKLQRFKGKEQTNKMDRYLIKPSSSQNQNKNPNIAEDDKPKDGITGPS